MSFFKSFFKGFGPQKIAHKDAKAKEFYDQGLVLIKSGDSAGGAGKLVLSLGCELHPLTFLALSKLYAAQNDFGKVEKNAVLGLKNCSANNSDAQIVQELTRLQQTAQERAELKRTEIQAVLSSKNMRAIFELFEVGSIRETVLKASIESIRFRIGERPEKAPRSRWGGEPDLPPNTPWPKSPSGTSLSFLMQIDCSELQKLPTWADRTSFSGMLSLFVEEWYLTTSQQENYKLLAFPYGEKLERRTLPASLTTENSAIDEHKIFFTEQNSFPDFETLSESCEVDFTKYDALLEAYDGEPPLHRILGNPKWVQGQEYVDSEYELLFQLDSYDGPCWGDSGRLYVFTNSNKLKQGDFSDTVAVFQD